MARSLNSNTNRPTRCRPERPERVVHHQLGRLRAVALAPRIGLADRDVEQGRAVVAVELAERAGPDEPVAVALVDGHRQRIRPDDPGGEEPLDLLGPHRALLVARQPGDLRVRVPAPERGRFAGTCRRRTTREPVSISGNHVFGAIVGTVYHRRHAPLERAGRACRGDVADLREDGPARRVLPLARRRRAADRGRLPDRPAVRRRRTSARPASAGRRSRRPSPAVAGATARRPWPRPTTGLRPRAWPSRTCSSAPATRRRPRPAPSLAEVAAAFDGDRGRRPGPAAQGRDPARPPRPLRPADGQGASSRSSAASCASACARASSRRPSPRPSTARSTTSSGPAC